ncbi:hypothetical protein, partial [Pradoshia sp.]
PNMARLYLFSRGWDISTSVNDKSDLLVDILINIPLMVRVFIYFNRIDYSAHHYELLVEWS